MGTQSLYYDPIIDYHHLGPSASGFLLYFQTAAQHREDTVLLVDSMVDQLGWNESPSFIEGERGIGPLVRTAALAREFGKNSLFEKLLSLAEEHYEPTWDSESGEFTWGFGLNETHPRGQLNAIMAYAEAGSEAAWWRLFNQPNLTKFNEPTVYGVDFPRVSLTQAFYDPKERVLTIALDEGLPDARGERTSFRVRNVDTDSLDVRSDADISWQVIDDELEVTIPVGPYSIQINQ